MYEEKLAKRPLRRLTIAIPPYIDDQLRRYQAHVLMTEPRKASLSKIITKMIEDALLKEQEVYVETKW